MRSEATNAYSTTIYLTTFHFVAPPVFSLFRSPKKGVEVWVNGVKSPTYHVPRPSTGAGGRGGGRSRSPSPSPERRGEGANGGQEVVEEVEEKIADDFVPDAEYHAQLIRLQALITKKQNKRRDDEQAEERREKVMESRTRRKKARDVLKAKGGVKVQEERRTGEM